MANETRNRCAIFFPVYHDGECFKVLYAKLRVLLATRYDASFIVIDDSAGADPDIAGLADLADVKIVPCPVNLGHQRALVFALRKAAETISNDTFVVTMDSDGQDQAEDVPRLLAALERSPDHIVLALRTKRKETALFKIMYVFFKILFRLLVGQVIRSGNFAAFRGDRLKSFIQRPTFDLCYSSSLTNLKIPLSYVGCERAERIAGESRMGFFKLIEHGLRMLTPFRREIMIRGGVLLLILGIGSVALWLLP